MNIVSPASCGRAQATASFSCSPMSIHRIYECLSRSVTNGRYITEFSRSRQRHWMLALQRQVADFGQDFRQRLRKALRPCCNAAGCRAHIICRGKRLEANPPKAVADKSRKVVIVRSKTLNEEDCKDRGTKKAA